MEQMIMGVIWNILILLITILAGVVIRFMAEKLGTEKLRRAQAQWESMEDLTAVAIKYAEQAWREYGGEKKKEKALAFLARELSRRGIKASEETLSDLIEAILREIKDALGEEWANTIDKETA